MTEASDAAAFDHAASVVAKINGNDAAGLQQAGELFAKLSLLGSLATYKVGVGGSSWKNSVVDCCRSELKTKNCR